MALHPTLPLHIGKDQGYATTPAKQLTVVTLLPFPVDGQTPVKTLPSLVLRTRMVISSGLVGSENQSLALY